MTGFAMPKAPQSRTTPSKVSSVHSLGGRRSLVDVHDLRHVGQPAEQRLEARMVVAGSASNTSEGLSRMRGPPGTRRRQSLAVHTCGSALEKSGLAKRYYFVPCAP